MPHKTFISASALAASLATTGIATAQDCAAPIKVGMLHSLSGSMAISETTLKDVMLMLIAQQNAAGDLLDCEIEAVVADPVSDLTLCPTGRCLPK